MDTLEAGTLLARRYRLLDRVGVGGMSVIWRARDEMLDRPVAVKVLASSLAVDPRFRELVRGEARAAAALVHPHVTAVYDYGETLDAHGDVTAYVVMELLDGRPLSAELTAGAMPWRSAVEVCAAVAQALAAAHRHGIVHRDITPDNVMLTDNGVKVLDFGIATTVGAQDEDADGGTFGTPAYVAPERLHGRRARPATDVYALGVLLYETLTGHPPYPADTWEELAAIRRDETPQPAPVAPGLPPAVAALCQRCLAADPIDRPSAFQVAEELRRHLPADGVARRGARRALAVTGTAAALALGLLLGATVLRPNPGAQEVPVYRPPLAGPTAGAENPPPPAPASPAPPPSPPAAPAPPPAPGPDAVTAPVTLADLVELIRAGNASGEIRDDVALDLNTMIRNLEAQLAAGTADLPAAKTALQEKVATRASEGAITVASAETLGAAVNQLVE